MTASVCLHGALRQLDATPANAGAVTITLRCPRTRAYTDVTLFTGSEQVAQEIYEALGPIFHRHGGDVRPVRIMTGGKNADPVS
jgi:hypothetical protein